MGYFFWDTLYTSLNSQKLKWDGWMEEWVHYPWSIDDDHRQTNRRINQRWWRLCPESCPLPSERSRSRSLEAASRCRCLQVPPEWLQSEDQGHLQANLWSLKPSQRRVLTNLVLVQSAVCPPENHFIVERVMWHMCMLWSCHQLRVHCQALGLS